MFGMSVNEVPGWLVAMAPSGIGVPVALTPGLLPQLDVSAVAAPALLDEPAAGVDPVLPVVLLLPLLLQPAAARARAAASRIVLRAALFLLICPPQGGEFGVSIHGHDDLDGVRRPAHRECERLGRAGQREMVREDRGEGQAIGPDQAYRLGEIPGRGAARAEDVNFLFREGPRPQRRRSRGQADDHDPAGLRPPSRPPGPAGRPRHWSRRPAAGPAARPP